MSVTALTLAFSSRVRSDRLLAIVSRRPGYIDDSDDSMTVDIFSD